MIKIRTDPAGLKGLFDKQDKDVLVKFKKKMNKIKDTTARADSTAEKKKATSAWKKRPKCGFGFFTCSVSIRQNVGIVFQFAQKRAKKTEHLRYQRITLLF